MTNLLIQMAQSGKIRSKVNEAQLIALLEQVEVSQGESAGEGASKITVSSKVLVEGQASARHSFTFLATLDLDIDSSVVRRQPSITTMKTLISSNALNENLRLLSPSLPPPLPPPVTSGIATRPKQ